MTDPIAPCWSEMRNPTQQHLHAAEEHRARADAHRRASRALRDAESRACDGVPELDRDISPLTHPSDVLEVPIGDPEVGSVMGARIVLRRVPGLTRDWLERAISCHLARNAALGHEVPEMPDCPLVPRGARAAVLDAGRDALIVEVSGSDPSTGEAIYHRAMMLGEPPPSRVDAP